MTSTSRLRIKYYTNPSGRSFVKDFVEDFPMEVAVDFRLAIERLKNGESLGMPLSKPLFNIARSVYELRLHGADSIYRVIYFIKKKDAIYLVHALKKKSQKLAEKDKKLIVKRVKEIKELRGK